MALIKREYTDHETVVTAENMNAIQDAIIALEDGLFSVDSDKSGEIITITDASKRGFRSLTVYGKTTQGGIPTPDAPVDMVSVGGGGSLSVSVSEKNLWDHSNDTRDLSSVSLWGTSIWRNAAVVETLKPKTTYTLKCKVTCLSVPDYASVFSDQCGFYLYANDNSATAKSMAIDIGRGVFTAGEQRILQGTFTTPETIGDTDMGYEILIYTQRYLLEDGTAVFATVRFDDVQLEIGDTASDYTPYTGQKLTISTPGGLSGIPVTSGGNYTDANGQQWVCDEIDLARGVYIKRIDNKLFDGSADELWDYRSEKDNTVLLSIDIHESANVGNVGATDFLCSHFEALPVYGGDIEGMQHTGKQYYLRVLKSNLETADVSGFRKILVSFPMTLAYILENPIETILPEEEIAAYNALYTYKDHTTVSNDAGAWMDLEYVMDAKKYLSSLVVSGGGSTARLSSVTLKADAWGGADSLYSQVVTIDGITEYSKVDLLPSVEQLAIFHNKDLAFVTENEGGVLTVFAIGEKPTNDYTMQVSITEVAV